MIEKSRIKDIANELGADVIFDSENPGFFSKSTKKFYSFSDLNQIIDNVFPMDDYNVRNEKQQKQENTSNLTIESDSKSNTYDIKIHIDRLIKKMSNNNPISDAPIEITNNNDKFFKNIMFPSNQNIVSNYDINSHNNRSLYNRNEISSNYINSHNNTKNIMKDVYIYGQ